MLSQLLKSAVKAKLIARSPIDDVHSVLKTPPLRTSPMQCCAVP